MPAGFNPGVQITLNAGKHRSKFAGRSACRKISGITLPLIGLVGRKESACKADNRVGQISQNAAARSTSAALKRHRNIRRARLSSG